MSDGERRSTSAVTEGRLAWLLVNFREELMERWGQRVLDDPSIQSANRLSTPALEDHIPELIDRLLERLAVHPLAAWGERVGREVGGSGVGIAHARQRLALQYTLAEALRELSLFRATVLDLCVDRLVSLKPDEAKLFHATIDEMMATSANALEQATTSAYEQAMGVIAHDLRNPISVISMQAARFQAGKVDDPRKAGENLARSARMMDRLVEDLLMYSKLEAGHFSVHVEEVDARDILLETCEHYRTTAERRNVALSSMAPSSAVQIQCDRDRLAQALGNLLGNAIKFSPKGGCVSAELEALADRCVFRVSDTGPGVSADHVDNIFRPFWQAPGTSNGAGLGLAIARGIIEAHGGELALEQHAPPGATFVFSLPRDGAASKRTSFRTAPP
jgi:signal transduction histidine kinase